MKIPSMAMPKSNFKMESSALHLHAINSDLEHFQFDTFIAKFRNQMRLTFNLDADGNVSKFTMAGIEFKRSAPGPAK